MHKFHFIKRFFVGIAAALLSTSFLFRLSPSTHAYTFTPDDALYSQAAVLYNVDSQQIVFEKNADQPQAPGHLAQIMTAIVVIELCSDLDQTTITADNELYDVLYRYDPDDVRYADIYNGDTLSVREYLYALLLTSSCEAALILEDYFSTDSESLVDRMNQKAKDLGCTATTFTNATGLYDPAQTTTARDMLTITNYALSLDGFEEIADTREYAPQITNTENHPSSDEWIWTHSNTMMQESSDYYYAGAEGIKTGNLNESGRSVITKATKDGNTYLVVLMNAPFTDEEDKLQYYHLEDAISLFQWAFSALSYTTLLEDDEELAEVEVANSDGNSYVLVRPENDCVMLWCDDVDITAVQRVIELEQNVQAPIDAGQQLGMISLKFSGEVIAQVPLVAVSSVDRSFSKFNLYALQNFPHSPWFRYGLIAGSICTVLYILICIYASYRAKRNVTPEDPIHLIPHVTDFTDRPQLNWKRSETVFYHGPNHNESKNTDAKKEQKSENETASAIHK